MKKNFSLFILIILLLITSCNLNNQDEHIWGEGVITKQPSCNEPGTISYKCSHCNLFKNDIVAPLGHDFSKESISPEYLADEEMNLYYKSCNRCGQKGSETFLHEHSWNNSKIKKEASCIEEGEEVFYCSYDGCSSTYLKVIVPKDHDFSAENVSDEYLSLPTNAEGEAIYFKSCIRCGQKGTETFSYKKPETHIHVWNEGSIIKEATCTDGAEIMYKCQFPGCKVINMDTSNPLGHSFSSMWKSDSTHHWNECSRCGIVKNKETHAYNSFTKICKCGIVERYHSIAYTEDQVPVIQEYTYDTGGKFLVASVLLGKIENVVVSSDEAKIYTGEPGKAYHWDFKNVNEETIRNSTSYTISECTTTMNEYSSKGSLEIKFSPTYKGNIEFGYKREWGKTIEEQQKNEMEKAYTYVKESSFSIDTVFDPEKNPSGFYKYMLLADCNIYGLTLIEKDTKDIIGFAYKTEYIPDSFVGDVFFDPVDKTFAKNSDTPELILSKSVLGGTIHFDANGGSVELDSKRFTYDEIAGELPIPTRNGYLFEGWYTELENGKYISETTLMHDVGDVTVYARWKKDNTYSMKRKSVALDSYFDSKTEEQSQEIRAHHNNWELGKLEVIGSTNSNTISGIRDKEGFTINYALDQDLNNIPNPRNVDISLHEITYDTWNRGFRTYDCKTNIGTIGKGTYVVRVEYEDGEEEFYKTNFLDGMKKGQSKQIFSSSQIDNSRHLKRIHIMVVYETFHSFHYGIFNWGWAEDFANWMCTYDFDF